MHQIPKDKHAGKVYTHVMCVCVSNEARNGAEISSVAALKGAKLSPFPFANQEMSHINLEAFFFFFFFFAHTFCFPFGNFCSSGKGHNLCGKKASI